MASNDSAAVSVAYPAPVDPCREEHPCGARPAADAGAAAGAEVTTAARPAKLLSFEFVAICVVTCLSICNQTVFYNLFGYLQSLGIPTSLCGVVVGTYSLTAMLLYLLASPFLNAANGPAAMLLGMSLLAASGVGYLFVHSFWAILGLRVLNGAGQFCIGAGAMSRFVTAIPAERSGQAFSIYSLAILISYGAMPALMDALAPYIKTPPHGYAATTLSLLPAAYLVWRIRGKQGAGRGAGASKAALPSKSDLRLNLGRLPVALLILLNMSYFSNWSSLFFLFKGFAKAQGIANVGSFFSVLTGLMIAIRLIGGKHFDSVDKRKLIAGSFVTIAGGHLCLDHLPGPWAAPLVGALFGLGMGAGYPAINGLMFQVSPARFRALNANLMQFAVQAGFFLGPVIGGAVVAQSGYHGFFRTSIALALASGAVTSLLLRE